MGLSMAYYGALQGERQLGTCWAYLGFLVWVGSSWPWLHWRRVHGTWYVGVPKLRGPILGSLDEGS